MMDGPAKRADWNAGVDSASSRARQAVVALLLSAVTHAAGACVSVWRAGVLSRLDDSNRGSLHATVVRGDDIGQTLAVVEIGMLILTLILFLRWLHKTIAAASTMGKAPLAWTPGQAVGTFFIPIVNLYRPYTILRDLNIHLAADGVPEPAPRARQDGLTGYREAAVEHAPPPRELPNGAIAAWWATYMLTNLSARGFGSTEPRTAEAFVTMLNRETATHVLMLVCALLGVTVVRAITARLVERNRRLGWSSDEELASLGL